MARKNKEEKEQKGYKEGIMKEYSKPMLELFEFSESDVILASASGFDISWLNVVPSQKEELE